jgi:hypothetical protein
MASVVINETYDSLIELQVQLTPLGLYMAGPAANFGGKYQTPKPGYVWHAPCPSTEARQATYRFAYLKYP